MITNTNFSIAKSSVVFPEVKAFNSSRQKVVGVLDYNNDGKMDFIVHVMHYDLAKADQSMPLIFMKGNGDGTFTTDTNALIGANPNIQDARLAIGDFNGDKLKDIVLIDSGTGTGGSLSLKGLQTYFLTGTSDGRFAISAMSNQNWYAKNLFVYDINSDGALDIFVESNGESGHSISSPTRHPPHFKINDGKGNFSVDLSRLPPQVVIANWATKSSDFQNQTQQTQENRYLGESLGDFNNDGFLDIVFPSLDLGFGDKGVNRFSKVLINDKKNNFPLANLIALPEPIWNGGVLNASSSSVGDLDGDGFNDLIISFALPDYSGRYIQILKNNNGTSFTDITEKSLGSQYLERQSIDSTGQKNANTAFDCDSIKLIDINRDGWLDIFVGGYTAPISENAPALYLNDGAGRFYAHKFTADYFNSGSGRVPFLIDANNDKKTDIGFVDFNGSGFEFNLLINDMNSSLAKTAYFNGKLKDYALIVSSDRLLTITDSIDSRDGARTLKNIDRIKFNDSFLAIDLNENAGTTVKILGAVFGKESVSNKNYVGIGLSFLDAGWTYDNLAALALDAAGAKTNDQIVSLLWTNVIGTKPTAADKAPFITLLENGMTAGALAHLAADTSFNTTNINLVGLAQTGIEYMPVG